MLGLYRTLWKKWRKNLEQLILGVWCFLVAVVATMGWCLLHAYFCSSMTAFSEGTSAVSRIVDIVFSNFSRRDNVAWPGIWTRAPVTSSLGGRDANAFRRDTSLPQQMARSVFSVACRVNLCTKGRKCIGHKLQMSFVPIKQYYQLLRCLLPRPRCLYKVCCLYIAALNV